MGLFSKKSQKDKKSDQHGTPVLGASDHVRKADGSSIRVAIAEIGPMTEVPDIAPTEEKGIAITSSYAIRTPSKSRQDSVARFARPRLKSMFKVNTDAPTNMEEYENDEPDTFVRKKWRSSRLQPGEVYEKPWLSERDPRKLYERIMFFSGCFAGLCLGGWMMYQSWMEVTNSEYCMILDDNFTSIDTSIWNYEIQIGGFGKGSFEWTTSDESNIYVDENGLHINPTLTLNTTTLTPDELYNGAILNLTSDGTCTSDQPNYCAIYSNATSGAIIPPVRSARINTHGNRAIQYGKVEVLAKMPVGDWLWPAIWMLPVNDSYGPWPLSGEIDIAQVRGNAPGYVAGGRDTVQSTLHWGPNGNSDAYWRTNGLHKIPRTDFSKRYHLFGLEWSPKYLFMYLDSRLLVGWPLELAIHPNSADQITASVLHEVQQGHNHVG